MDTKHLFETAGLGQAPFKFLGVNVESSSCQYCATAIMFQFWLESADGKKFYVGSDCIFKSGDAGLRRIIEPIIAKHQKELKDKREAEVISTFEGHLKMTPDYWKQDNGPHPYAFYAEQGKTMGDYKKFCYEHAGQSTKAKVARQALIGLGVLKPTRKSKEK